MKYRIRMSMLEWFVRIYDAQGKLLRDEGPFKDFKAASDFAEKSGYLDWDKMQ